MDKLHKHAISKRRQLRLQMKRRATRFTHPPSQTRDVIRESKTRCADKIRYNTESLARDSAFSYRQDILFSTIDYYFCEEHQGYHLGHNWRITTDALEYREYSFLIETAAEHRQQQ
jgi:hypothetical protein